MTKRKNPYPETTIQGIITDLLAEGPLVGLYFSVAIMLLKEKIDEASDDELLDLFAGLLHPDRIRLNVNYIFEKLDKRQKN